MRDTDFVGSFAKGIRIIEAFGEQTPRLSIAEASASTGLDRATARRCLLTLAELGYADYDGKYFSLTPRVLRLGYAYLSAAPLPHVVQPFLDRLSDEVGQSASVSVRDGAEVVYVARAARRRLMAINLMPGSRLPAYCASMGRVLLAAMPEDEARALLDVLPRQAFTARTKTGIEELMDELAIIRERGFAIIDQELEPGLCSIAVPLLDAKGRAVAAMNIGAPAAVIPAEELAERFLERMQAVAMQMRPLLRS